MRVSGLLGLFSDLRVFVVLGCAPAETGTLGIPVRTLETEVKPGLTQDHLTSQSFKPFKSGSDFFFLKSKLELQVMLTWSETAGGGANRFQVN